nr:hypothetical protein CFP56_31118 [Quercus suber]
MRGPQVQVRGRILPNLVSALDKRKLLLEKNAREKQNPVFEQRPVSLSGPVTLGGRELGSRCINEEFEFGVTNTVWTGVGLTVEVDGEGNRRVAWNSNKGGLRNSFWGNSNQREHVVGQSSGSRAYQNSVVNKGVLRRSKWVIRSQDHSQVQKISVVGSDPECNTQVGLPVVYSPKPTGPTRMAKGESSFSSAQNYNPIALTMPNTPHDLLVAQNGTAGLTVAVGSLAVGSPASLVKVGCSSVDSSEAGRVTEHLAESSFDGPRAKGSPAILDKVGCSPVDSSEAGCLFSEGFRAGEPRFSLVQVEISRSKKHVVSPATVRQTDADGGLLAQPWCASPVGVSGCTENLQHMVFRYRSDRNSFLGSNKLSGGLVSEDMRSVTLEFVPRLVGPFFPDRFLEFWRVGSMGFGVSGKEANASSNKELLSLPREVMLVEDVADFFVGSGEAELSDCLPLQIIAPSVSTTLAELEEVTEQMTSLTYVKSFVSHQHISSSSCPLVFQAVLAFSDAESYHLLPLAKTPHHW